jgi:hypothetical protein
LVLDSTSSLAALAVVNRSADAQLSSQVSVTTQESRIRFADIDVSAESALSSQVTRLGVISADISSEFALSATVENIQFATAGLSAVSSLSTSKRFGDIQYSSLRPKDLFGGIFDSSEKKYGTHSLAGTVERGFDQGTPNNAISPPAGEDWAFEFWDKDIRDGCEINVGNINIVPFSSTDRRHRFRLVAQGGSFLLSQTSPTPSIGAWDHWAIVKTGSRYSFYAI